MDKTATFSEKETSLKNLFGTWKTKKTAQKLKDESREDWE